MNEILLHHAYNAHQRGNLAEAARLYGEVLRADPRQVDALCLLALLHAQRGAPADANRIADRALELANAATAGTYKIGCLMQNFGRHAEARDCFDKVLKADPKAFDALVQRGIALLGLKDAPAALASFEGALCLRPQDVGALNNRGAALVSLGRFEDCIVNADMVLALQPGNVIALLNRAIAQANLGQYEQAIAGFDRVLADNPNHADALFRRGNALLNLEHYQEALVSLEHFAALAPAHADGLTCLGVAHWGLLDKEPALACFDRALALDPASVSASVNRATVLFSLDRFEEASRECDRAFALDPEYRNGAGLGLFYRLQCCDWRGLEQGRVAIDADLRAGKAVIAPLHYFAISESESQQLTCARVFAAGEKPAPKLTLGYGERYGHDRIRLAYISADFRAHPVAYQIAGVLGHHDRRRFETIAVSMGPDDKSPIRDRVMAGVDRFIDMAGEQADEIALRLKEMEIDIAVDLMGLTTDAQPSIFAQRPAGLQVNYLGFPGTMGVPHYDYILSDRTVIPEESRQYYSEQVAYLPRSFMPAGRNRVLAEGVSRETAGLPGRGFVFASFNNTYKILPATFSIWMRLLQAVEESVLWLPQSNEPAIRNLKREAQARGIAAERLIFAPFVKLHEDHLARLALADLFLDTLPYNAHATACDALSAGVPLVTCKGSTLAGRVATSVLQTAGVPELVTHSLEEYETLALRLARDAGALAAIRAKLVRSGDENPLFDVARYTSELEAAFVTMWERARQGLPPESFAVSADAALAAP